MLIAVASLKRALTVALVAITMSASTSPAVFVASEPGAPLLPADEAAATAIDLVQSGNSILWISKAGEVATVTTLGWPKSDGDAELGGAVVIEAVYRTTGTLSIGEAPKTVSFAFEG